jgi:Protein of unknown function (DUF4231)
MKEDAEEDLQPTAREARAQRYFERDLKGQREWYGKRASTYKQNAQLLSIFIISAGALTTFVQIFPATVGVAVVTAGLGVLIAVAEGWQRIARYRETWIAYRTASERMKQELRLFVNGVGRYRGLGDDDAFAQFVETIEGIIAEEQQIYWQALSSPAPRPQHSSPSKYP